MSIRTQRFHPPVRLTKHLLILLVVLLSVGCSPKEEQTAQTPQREPSPTPEGQPFVILTDANDSDLRILRDCVAKSGAFGEVFFPRWDKSSDSASHWDMALVKPWTGDKLEGFGTDLRPLLSEAYPKYRNDLFVSIPEEGPVLSIAVVLIPDFLFALKKPQWNFQFDRNAFESEVKSGAKVALAASPLTNFYRKELGISESQTVEVDLADPENAFAKGEVGLAIGPKGWLLEKQVPGLSTISLADVGFEKGIPHSGYVAILPGECVEPNIARSILGHLITEGQLSLVGLPDAFPIRRSIYATPRVQGPLTAFYKTAFDRTLANLTHRVQVN